MNTRWFSGSVLVNTYSVTEYEEPDCVGCDTTQVASIFIAQANGNAYPQPFYLHDRSVDLNLTSLSPVTEIGNYRNINSFYLSGDYLFLGTWYDGAWVGPSRKYLPDSDFDLSPFTNEHMEVCAVLDDRRIISERWDPTYVKWRVDLLDFEGETPEEREINLIEYQISDDGAPGYECRLWHPPIIIGNRLIKFEEIEYWDASYNMTGSYKFWIVDLDTLQVVHETEIGPYPHPSWWQWPVSPPVIIGSKIYYTANKYYQSSPIIEIDICTGAYRMNEPELYESTVALFCTTYNLETGKINAFCSNGYDEREPTLKVDDTLVEIDPVTLEITDIEEKPTPVSGVKNVSILKSPNGLYLLRDDGSISPVSDLNTIVANIPPVVMNVPGGTHSGFPWRMDEPALDKVCPTITADERIWILDGDYLKGVSLKHPTPDPTIEVPATVASITRTSNSRGQFLILVDDKLIIQNKGAAAEFQTYIVEAS
jgi:hypothetical protein